MKKSIVLASLIALAACSTPDSSSFRVGNIKYEDLSKNHAVKETRLFKKFVPKNQSCPLQHSAETIPALVLAGVGYIGKELIAYGKSELESRAQYLESDVSLNSKAILPVWPSDDANNAELCLLVIAGEFGDTPDGKVLERFRESQVPSLTNPSFTKEMAEYNQNIPGVGDVIGPFTGIQKDPTFLLEIKVVPTKTSDGKWYYTASPTYLLYPNPLHMMTSSKVSRKLTVEYSLGLATGAIALDGFDSGAAYKSEILQQRYSITDQKGSAPTTVATVKVIEGPDKMPTAKLMRELASKDKELQALLDEKLKEIEAAQVASKK